jgi:putative transposase
MRCPSISLFQHRTALKAVQAEGQQTVSGAQIFRTIEEQRRVIANAKRTTTRARRRSRKMNGPLGEVLGAIVEFRREPLDREAEAVDYDRPVQAFDVEQW